MFHSDRFSGQTNKMEQPAVTRSLYLGVMKDILLANEN